MGAAIALATAIFAASTNLILRREIAQLGGAVAQTWRATLSTLVFAVVFLGERPTMRNIIGTLIAFGGVALVV